MRTIFVILFIFLQNLLFSQNTILPKPPMGFMTWNFYGENIHEDELKKLADVMVEKGFRDLGYNYIFIDDGWQGGRDKYNNLIPDPKKFPSGLKNLADYLHSKGMKLGIYSDAAPLTCAGYTASLNFEKQDAKTFADWGIDYLKYDYCGAPKDQETAINRYKVMSNALKSSGRDIALAICEWGDRQPWLWARNAGGSLWRTTADIRDKWKSLEKPANASDLHRTGAGILDIVNINADLSQYAGNGGWNDPDMLVIGLYGKKGSSSDLGGVGCKDTEYQSQMSLWCLMAAPLYMSFDIKNMNVKTKEILTNKDAIAINQDSLGKQAKRIVNTQDWQVFIKTLQNGEFALGILNVSDKKKQYKVDITNLGLFTNGIAKDLWTKKVTKLRKNWKVSVESHETKLFKISK